MWRHLAFPGSLSGMAGGSEGHSLVLQQGWLTQSWQRERIPDVGSFRTGVTAAW